MTALIDRHEREADRMTVAVAEAIAISLDKEYAAEWQRARGGTEAKGSAPMNAMVLGAVMRQFPGVIKVN